MYMYNYTGSYGEVGVEQETQTSFKDGTNRMSRNVGN